MKKILLVLLTCTLSQLLIAQKNGSFTTTSGESFEGKIYLRLESKRVDELVLKVGKNKSLFKAHKVLSLQFDNGDAIKTIKYNGRYQFAKLESSGPYLTYYKIADPNQERKELTLPLLVKQDNSQLEVGNIGFKNRVSKFLRDCPEVADQVSNGTFKKTQIAEIAASYNACRIQNQKQTPVVIEPKSIEEQPAVIALINKISQSDMESKNDIVEMLNDVKGKLEEGEQVPKYLKGAIIEALGDNASLIKEFEAVLK